MKISIITVCYNSATTIAKTLRSVREQTHDETEHIIVDGGSRDNTLAVVASEGAHVVTVVSERDGGIYDAMNKGIRLATGEVVAFLNADDFYINGSVLAKVGLIMHKEKLDALYGDVEFFRSGKPDVIARRYNSGRFAPDRLGWGWMPAHPALFMRKELFDRYGEFDTSYRIAGDFEFIARVFARPGLRHRHLRQPLVRMQMGGASTSGWRATVQINREMMRACRANGISTNWLKMLARYPLKAFEFLNA